MWWWRREPNEFVDVVMGQAEQLGDDRHGKPVGHRAHPLDLAGMQILIPQTVCGPGGELFDDPHALGRSVGQQMFRCSACAGSSAVASAVPAPRLSHVERR